MSDDVPRADVDDVGGLAPSGGTPDMGSLLDSLQKVNEARAASYEGSAGGGAVRVEATGDMQFQSVTIDPAVVDPDDVEMLQDLVLAALHDLANSMAEAQQSAMGGLGDIGGLLGGLGGGDELPDAT